MGLCIVMRGESLSQLANIDSLKYLDEATLPELRIKHKLIP
jgi:hypothetical protein